MQSQAKAIILARVSSRTQEEVGYSLDSQLKLLRSYCKDKNLAIVKEFRITETASKQQRRVVFQELLEYIRRHRIYHFVVEKTDRLTRNLKDAAYIDDWLEEDEHRILHVVKENLQLYRGARSQTKFMWGFFVAWAKHYTDNLREEAMKGWAEKLAQGWMPAPPPFGYMKATDNGKHIHVPNPSTMHLVHHIFEFYLLPDQSIKTVREEMAKMGIVTRGGRSFAKSAVARMLGNPFYIGTIRFDGKEYPGAHEPIISKELFEAVQKKLHRIGVPKYRMHNPIFKGMLRCVNCNGVITWQKQKGRYYGMCQKRTDVCQGKKCLREDKLERKVTDVLDAVKDLSGAICKKLESLLEKERHPYVGMHRDGIIEGLNKQLDRLRRMEGRLYDLRLAGEISDEQYKAKSQDLADQTSAVKGRLLRLYEAQEKQRIEEVRMDTDNPITRLYLRGTPAQKRIIITQLFGEMKADGDNVDLSINLKC